MEHLGVSRGENNMTRKGAEVGPARLRCRVSVLSNHVGSAGHPSSKDIHLPSRPVEPPLQGSRVLAIQVGPSEETEKF